MPENQPGNQGERRCPLQFCRHAGVKAVESERPSVPPVLTEPAAIRLRVAAGAAALLWGAYLALSAAAHMLSGWSVSLGAAAILSSVAIVCYTLSGRATPSSLRIFGSAYVMLIALALALTEASSLRGGVSWSAVWIAIFPLLVPCSPRRVLYKAFVAASLSPIAYFALAASRGAELPGAAELLMTFAPVYLAGFVAFVASQALTGLGAEVNNARQMGMYELETPIAQGGMGEVWRARHQLLSRPAAVKLIRPNAGQSTGVNSDEIARRRFELEAQVTASLQSPHTVELYDFGVTKSGTIYYVMELLEGVDLETLVQRQGPLPPRRVVHILKQVLDSLAEAHERGLVHRDIKPANINLSRRGLENDFVKVLDFGLVKSRETSDKMSNSLTAANGIVGTPAYLAPELLTGEGTIDGRADLYALGCVAYYLLTGHLVFDASTAMQMAIAHVAGVPVPPSQRVDQPIPPQLERIVMTCLAKRPENRPANAQAMLRALNALEFDTDAIPPVAEPDTRFPRIRSRTVLN
jgi:eukaryotic-like serine/threonine-protein kinase